MKKIKLLVLSMLIVASMAAFTGCGTTNEDETGSNTSTEVTSETGKIEEIATDAATRAKEIATDAASDAQEIVTDVESGVENLTGTTSSTETSTAVR